ncbi:MAG: penicillin-binding protein 2 [Thermodesulfobacteriota bacterium]
MATYFGDKEPAELKDRIIPCIWVIAIAFAALFFRFWYLQVIRSNYFTELSLSNRIRIAKAHAPRGFVYDRNGILLAESRPGFDLAVVPEDVEDWDKTKLLLKKLTGIDEDEIKAKIKESKLRRPYHSIRLKEDVSWEEMARVKASEYELPGVVIEVSPKRNYVFGEATAHLIGYVGEINDKEYAELKKKVTPFSKGGSGGIEDNPYALGDVIGKYGLESVFENELKGADGGKRIEVDAHGRAMRVIEATPPSSGQNISLTIDILAQMAAYEAMKDKSGAVVALDPRNGAVLAMVSAPGFDSNAVSAGIGAEEWEAIIKNPLKVLNNKAIQGAYPPASTFKLITAAAALEKNVITRETRIFSGPSFRFGNKEFRDWKEEGHGIIDVHTAIVESADTFFYQVGLKTGIEGLAEYSRRFGLGEKTGIELKNEKPGLVPTTAWKKKALGTQWYEGETVSVSVGQGYMLATPLQMANAFASMANGGKIYLPRIIEKIETSGGTVIKEFTPTEKSSTGISPQTISLLVNALRGVVTEDHGTARSLDVPNLKIAGKTGTAQVVKLKERIKNIKLIPYEFRDHAWFVGFAPYDDPKIAVAVIVEHGGFGSAAAAPVALKVIQAYLGAAEKTPAPEKKVTPFYKGGSGGIKETTGGGL